MSYVVLARKWRPQSFDDLVGQEHVAQTLGNAIALGRVAHAFLFTGVRGVGKTTSARILAKALNCVHGPTAKPCLECSPCVEIMEGRDMDVQEIDGATYTSVDDIRDLQEKLPYRPARDRFKIYIVDEVHMLSKSAWNAFLKTLEEPPPHVKFIFATTEVEKVPVTILSRCQRYDFKLIAANKIAARLRHVLDAEKIEADDEALTILAREAAGSMRDAMSLLDQVIAWAGPNDPSGGRLTAMNVARVLGVASRTELHALAEALVDGNAAASLRIVGELAQQGFDIVHVARDLLAHLRDLVVAHAAPDDRALVDVPDAELAALRALAGRSALDDLCRLHQGLSRTFDDISKSVAPRGALEMTLVRLAARPPLVPVDDLVRRLVELEQRLGGGGGGGGRSGGAGASGGAQGGAPPRAMGGGARAAEAEGAPVFAIPAFVAKNEERRAKSEIEETRPRIENEERASGPKTEDRRPKAEDRPGYTNGNAAHTFAAPPPSAPPRSAAPPSFAPPSAPPPTPLSLDEQAKLARFAPVVEAVRASNVRLASLLERAHVVDASDGKLTIAFEAGGFETSQIADGGSRSIIESAVIAKMAGAAFSLEEIPHGSSSVTLARFIDDARKAKRRELEDAARNHPLVVAATRELGAEIREIRLPDDIEVATAPN
jgi:DNA polymerase-3 subunit gamma/tau